MDYSTSEADKRTATEVFLALNGGHGLTISGTWSLQEFRRIPDNLGCVARLRYRNKELGLDLWEEIVVDPETILYRDSYGDVAPMSSYRLVKNELLAAVTRLSCRVKAEFWLDGELTPMTHPPAAWMNTAADSLSNLTLKSLAGMVRGE